jgi:hypothetical protein
MSLVLGRLCAEGLVRREGGGLFISDLDKLVMRLAPAARPPLTDFEESPPVSTEYRQEA